MSISMSMRVIEDRPNSRESYPENPDRVLVQIVTYEAFAWRPSIMEKSVEILTRYRHCPKHPERQFIVAVVQYSTEDSTEIVFGRPYEDTKHWRPFFKLPLEKAIEMDEKKLHLLLEQKASKTHLKDIPFTALSP